MKGIWDILVNILLPIPLVSLVLLCIPLPHSYRQFIKKYIIKIVDSIIFFRIYENVTVYGFATTLSALTFIVTSLETFNQERKPGYHFGSSDLAEKLKCIRWRCERNFWISFLALLLWLILLKMRTLMKELEALKDVNEVAEDIKAKKDE